MGVYIKGIDLPRDIHGELVLDDIRLIFSNTNTRFSIPLDKDDIIEIDLVRCEECNYQYMCGHQINRHGLTLKLTCCEYGERRADD